MKPARYKIVVVGHSFGSILGILMARARPDLFLAYVCEGGLKEGENQRGSWE